MSIKRYLFGGLPISIVGIIVCSALLLTLASFASARDLEQRPFREGYSDATLIELDRDGANLKLVLESWALIKELYTLTDDQLEDLYVSMFDVDGEIHVLFFSKPWSLRKHRSLERVEGIAVIFDGESRALVAYSRFQ